MTPNPEIVIEGLNGAYFRVYMNISGFEYEKYEDYEIWRHDFYDIKIFEMKSTEQYDRGLEYEFILKQKTAINKIEIPIESEGLTFNYQPEMSGGPLNFSQPENVIGSYAVYYDGKRDNEYKTGKLFHIYRPLLIDADNQTEWADIQIDEQKNILKVDLPTKFLKKAKYPVIVDPTFGYTYIGGSQFNVAEEILIFANYSIADMAISVAHVSKIFAYTHDRNQDTTITRAFIADDSETYIHNSLDYEVNVTWRWWEFKGLNYNATGADVYWLGLITKDSTGIQCKYDLVGAHGGGTAYDNIGAYFNPYTFTINGYAHGVAMSIYAEYELPSDPVIPEPPEPVDETPYLAIGIILSLIIILLFIRRRN